jgi:hypothetical protein
MTQCPTCGAESEDCWRCSECGRDLVDVDDDDDGPDAAPLVADGSGVVPQGSGIDPYVCPRGHHAIERSQERVRCQTCRDYREYDTYSWPLDEVVDLREREPPLDDDRPPLEAKRERVPDVDVAEIDEVFYGGHRAGVDRTLHVTEDCPGVEKMREVCSAPASHPPPRGDLCEICAPDLTLDDVRATVATDGGRVPPGPSTSNRDPRRVERDSVRASERGGVGDQDPPVAPCPHTDVYDDLPCPACFVRGDR